MRWGRARSFSGISRPLGALSLLLLLASTTFVWAQARKEARLSYERKPGTDACQDEAALRDAVAVRLGYDPFAANRGPLVHVIVRPADKGYRATIELKSESDAPLGSRQVSSAQADCVELSSVVALAISMAIDPLAQAPQSTATATASPAPAPVPTPAASNPPAPAKTAELSPSVPMPAASVSPYSVHAAGGVAWGGVAPGPSFALLAGARVREGLFSLALEGRVQFTSNTLANSTAIAPPGTTVSASLLGASLVGCVHYQGFGGCVVPVVGSLRGTASLERAISQSSLFGGLGLRVSYDYAVSKLFSVGAFLEALAVLTPTQFVFQKGVAWEAAPLGGTGGALLRVHFP